MAIPTDLQIQIYQGDDVTITVQITDSAGASIDYTVYDQWLCYWRTSESNPEHIIGNVTISGQYLLIDFTSSQTRAMARNGVLDLQTVDNGKIRTWFKAKTIYVLDVTR